MSDWNGTSKHALRLVRWCANDEIVLMTADGGMVKTSKSALEEAMKVALRDLVRVSEGKFELSGELELKVGHGCLCLHAGSWAGCAGFEVLGSA